MQLLWGVCVRRKSSGSQIVNLCRVWGDRTISHHRTFAVRVVVSETGAETGTGALPAPGQQLLGAGLELWVLRGL